MFAFLFSITVANAQEGVVNTQKDDTASQYVVQPGDTLWSLSEAFLGNPEYWPKLWSINQYITNPHWIYPGNVIGFTPGTTIDPPQIDILTGQSPDGYVVEPIEYSGSESTCGPDLRFDFKQPTGTFSVSGFIAPKEELEILGTVEASPHNQSFVVERDKVYMSLSDPELYSCGDVVSIFRRVKKRIHHPSSYFKKYGDLYEIVGEATVIHQYGNYVVGEIRTSFSEIKRGDMVGKSIPTVVQLEVNTPKGSLQGVIIEQLSQEHSFSTERDTVFIDRGSNDGLIVGDSFYVISQRDPYVDARRENYALPPTVIGRIVVVQVQEDHAVAIVTDVNDEIKGINSNQSGRKDFMTAGVSITQEPF